MTSEVPSSGSLSSVLKRKSAMGGVSGEVGCVTSKMGERFCPFEWE